MSCPKAVVKIKYDELVIFETYKCKSFLNTIEGTKFLSQGCAVRLSCPISENFQRDPKQSEYHMSVFKTS